MHLFHMCVIPNLVTSRSQPIGLFHTHASLIPVRLHSPVLNLYRKLCVAGFEMELPCFLAVEL